MCECIVYADGDVYLCGCCGPMIADIIEKWEDTIEMRLLDGSQMGPNRLAEEWRRDCKFILAALGRD